MKKACFKGLFCLKKFRYKKALLTMSLSSFFLTAILFTTTASVVHSQNATVSLKGKNVKVSEVLETIENQTDYLFFYNKKNVDVDRNVSASFNNKSVAEVLHNIFAESDVNYSMVGNHIILSKVEKSVAQTHRVKGNVVDKTTGEPMIGVNVILKGLNKAVVTDLDGRYDIEVPNAGVTISYSFMGYLTEEVVVGEQNMINVELVPDVQKLDEVVVIGYGTVKKKDLTGAVSVVGANDFKNVKALSVGEAMQGLASGVQVRGTGSIGSEPNIEIRGIGNFGSHDPLYVIDGLITTGGIRDLNVNDIESIQVLKDASAAAIYGNRAANGVVIITTKKGKKGDMKVDFSSKFSIDKVKRIDLMDTTEFFKYNDMAYRNAKLPVQDHYKANTDWQDETFQTGYSQDYNLGVSGANDNSSYLISLNYFNNEGTTKGTDLTRYNFRVNTEGKRGIFTIGENLAISNMNVTPGSSGNPFTDAMRMTPDIPLLDPTHPGGYGYGDEAKARTFATNPVAIQNLVNNKSANTRIRGNVYLEAKLFSFLTYKLNGGYETSFDSYKSLRKSGSWTLNQPVDSSSYYENKAQYQSKLIENTLSFDKTFGKHHIDGVVGTSYQQESYEQINGSNKYLVAVGDYYFDVLNAGRLSPVAGGFRNETKLNSYLGRVNYNYGDRYLLSTVLRRDATSKFAKDQRVGYFPSVSVGWRVSNESFFKVDWISDLKLRANYGTLGNAAIENWAGNSGQYSYLGSLSYFPMAAFGTSQDVLSGMTQRKLVNTDLHWETKTQKNFGADIAFLQNKLQVSADYFISVTKDVLVDAPILLATGNDGGNPVANAASLENKGFELSALWKDQIGEFHYSVSANVTKLYNKVLDLGYGKKEVITNVAKTEVGQPIGMFYVIKTNGIFKNQDEVLANKNSKGQVIVNTNGKLPEPGDVRYIDYNDDGIISSTGDRQICGNPWPKFELGLNFNAEYKNFDFSIQGFGAFGQKVWNLQAAVLNRFDDNTNYLKGINPWTVDNPNTDFPRLLYGDDRNVRGDQDRWIEDGSFFKIRQITLGYTMKLPKYKMYFEQLRVSVTAQNYFTFTKYKGLDPEFVNGNVYEKGVDPMSYPSPKSLSLALSVTF